MDRIRSRHPDWKSDGFICREDLNRFRKEYVEHLIREAVDDLSDLERDVVGALRQHELSTANPEAAFGKERTPGEKLADRIAAFGGSWTFLLCFFLFLLLWIGANLVVLGNRSFDSSPYLLLNLVLSCLAAIQAPIIMMSQKRQEARDRLRAEHDYKVDLKAELEIRLLSEKIDHLLTHQWQRLLEIQRIQVELMEDLAHERGSRGAERESSGED